MNIWFEDKRSNLVQKLYRGMGCHHPWSLPVKRLVDFKDTQTFKLATELRKQLLLPNNFEKKIVVRTALQILSHSTESALKFMLESYDWDK